MKNIVNHLKAFKPSELTFEKVGAYVKGIDIAKVHYRDELPPALDPGNYSRNILLLEPLECVLLHWPPGVESAIHFHQGFWGYVLVFEGICQNVEYSFQGRQLREVHNTLATRGSVIPEPDGAIHKIANPSEEEALITVHFYFPALENLDGLKLFDMETGRIGILNEKAQTASFLEPEAHFHEIIENAFQR